MVLRVRHHITKSAAAGLLTAGLLTGGISPAAWATEEAEETTLTVARRPLERPASVEAAGGQTLSVVRTTTGPAVVEEVQANPPVAPEEEMEAVPYASVPEPVRKTVEKELGGKGDFRAARFSEEGAQLYQVSAIRDGLGVELILSDEGEIIVVTREVPFSKLPVAAQTALRRHNPEGRFTTIQEVTARAYSATYRNEHGEDVELRLDPAGLLQDEEGEPEREPLPEGGAE